MLVTVSAVPTSRRSRSLWRAYCRLVERYLFLFEITDDTISRLLFFSPLSTGVRGGLLARWRELVWGVLQLNRLAVDLALRQGRQPVSNSYGASVAVSDEPRIPATSIRILLTVLQSLGPLLQEPGRLPPTEEARSWSSRRESRVRAWIERVRFLLRGCLLYHYWMQMLWEEREESSITPTPGLLMDGGLFMMDVPVPNVTQERRRIEQEQYRGRRSGRRVVPRHDGLQSLTPIEDPSRFPFSLQANRLTTVRGMLGELMYILRPLYQAESELRSGDQTSLLLRSWLTGFAIDLVSLWTLKKTATQGNEATQYEWKRRRLRLLLYLLRLPVWDLFTEPVVDKLSLIMERVPLIGGLGSNYLHEWLYYWRLYRVEEG